MFVLMAFQAHADVMHLKSGKQIHFQKTWVQDGQIKGLREGSVSGTCMTTHTIYSAGKRR
jgi:hypothetical protein